MYKLPSFESIQIQMNPTCQQKLKIIGENFSMKLYAEETIYLSISPCFPTSNQPVFCQILFFIPPENTRKTKGFLLFSGNISRKRVNP